MAVTLGQLSAAQLLQLLKNPSLNRQQQEQVAAAYQRKTGAALPDAVAATPTTPAATGASPASSASTNPSLGADWREAFALRHNGQAPTAQDAFDRQYSLSHAGSGPNGTWTDADWRRTYYDRQEAYDRAGRPGEVGNPRGTTPSLGSTMGNQTPANAGPGNIASSSAGTMFSYGTDRDLNSAVGQRADTSASMPGADLGSYDPLRYGLTDGHMLPGQSTQDLYGTSGTDAYGRPVTRGVIGKVYADEGAHNLGDRQSTGIDYAAVDAAHPVGDVNNGAVVAAEATQNGGSADAFQSAMDQVFSNDTRSENESSG